MIRLNGLNTSYHGYIWGDAMELLRRGIYYARLLQPGDKGYRKGFDLFSEPESRRLNVLPIDTALIVSSGGRFTEASYKCTVRNGLYAFSEGDRAYINTVPGSPTDPFCNDADYLVRSVETRFFRTTVIFEKIIHKAVKQDA